MIEKISKDLKESMKKKDAFRTKVLRFLLAELKKTAIDKGKKKEGLSEEEAMAILKRQIKMRKETIEEFKKAGKEDDIQDELKEMEILEEYQPKQLSDEELGKVVEEAIKEVSASSMRDMGKVMKAVMQKYQAQVNGKKVQEIVKAKLS